MEILVRKFSELTLEQLYRILKLRSEVFVVEQTCPYLDPDGLDEGAIHFFIEEEGKILAYCRVLEKGVSFPEVAIGRVLADPAARGKGLSRKLMESAIRYIIETMGETEIQIAAQAYLIDFYGSFGFKTVSEVYLEDDIPHVNMILRK